MMGTPLNNSPPFVKTLCPEPKPFLPLLLTARDWFSAGNKTGLISYQQLTDMLN